MQKRRIPKWPEQGRALAQVLDDRGIGKTEFATRLGLQYYHVHRWCLGFAFGPDAQALAARELGLPDDTFNAPSAAALRELEAVAVLERFAREVPIATSLTEVDWKVLRSVRFPDASLRPSVAFYTAVSFALKGAIRVDEIDSVAAENAALDESLANKPPLRRR